MPGLEAGPDPEEPPATLPEPNPEHSSSDETGSGVHGSYVSPKVILCQKPEQEGPE